MAEEKIITILKMSKTGNSCKVGFQDGEFIYLPIDLILKFQLTKDFRISEEVFTQLIEEKMMIDARRYAYYIVSIRMHSEYEIKQKLKLKGFKSNQIENALDFLKSQNLIDDYKFAESFAVSSFKRKGYIAGRIINELKKKGINTDIANSVCADLNDENEVEEKLKLLIEKKLRLKKNKSKDKQKNYIIRSLSDLGYDYKLISDVINNYFFIID